MSLWPRVYVPFLDVSSYKVSNMKDEINIMSTET